MKLKYSDTSTRMNIEDMLDQIFPTQEKYREITRDIFDIFIEKGKKVSARNELEVKSVVSRLERRGHNRHTVYKVLREHLVPMGVINWKKFEGSMQLSNRFGNSMRRFSVSWKNFLKRVQKGEEDNIKDK